MEERCYRHLREEDRALIEKLLIRGYSKRNIAEVVGVHRSTIYRALKRNSFKSHQLSTVAKQYISVIVQKKYCKRRKWLSKIYKDVGLQFYIHDTLNKGWSPWQIEGRLKREHEGKCLISHESIYRYIYGNYGIRNKFYKRLRRKYFWRIKRNSCCPRIPKD